MKIIFQLVAILTAGLLAVVAAPIPHHQERAIEGGSPDLFERGLWRRSNSRPGSTSGLSGSTAASDATISHRYDTPAAMAAAVAAGRVTRPPVLPGVDFNPPTRPPSSPRPESHASANSAPSRVDRLKEGVKAGVKAGVKKIVDTVKKPFKPSGRQ